MKYFNIFGQRLSGWTTSLQTEISQQSFEGWIQHVNLPGKRGDQLLFVVFGVLMNRVVRANRSELACKSGGRLWWKVSQRKKSMKRFCFDPVLVFEPLSWPLTPVGLTGFYMYIETSRPRLDGDKARLLSPIFNMNTKSSSSSSSITNNPTYCFAFYYHMYGRHIGKTAEGPGTRQIAVMMIHLWPRWFVSAGALNVFLRQKGQTVTDTSVWSLTGNQGDRWRQAKVNIHPTTAFQVQTTPTSPEATPTSPPPGPRS